MALSTAVGELEDLVRSRLQDVDVRYTVGRARIVRLIEAAPGPKSAAALHAMVRDDVPLSSLYRTLDVLSEAGVLERSHRVEGVTLFELAEWLRGHHHHLVCTECGSVEDVDAGPKDEEILGAFAERIATSQGFLAKGHRIDVEGTCGRCAA